MEGLCFVLYNIRTLLFNVIVFRIRPANVCHSKPVARLRTVDAQALGGAIRFESQVVYLEPVRQIHIKRDEEDELRAGGWKV